MTVSRSWAWMILLLPVLSGCAVVSATTAVVSTAVDVTTTAVGVTVDAAGALADAAIPDGDDKNAR